MPWEYGETVVGIRVQFIKLWLDGRYLVSELCARFGVSRKTAYKWIARYQQGGFEALKDLSKAPKTQPSQVTDYIERAILAHRDAHPTWGPKKIITVLQRHHPDDVWPAPSTVYEVLRRNGRIKSGAKKRRHHKHPGKPIVDMDRPNSVWAVDFKGEFKLGNGRWCYPLTITDGCSRMLICCHALGSTKLEAAKKVFTAIFKQFGLPDTILSDNGTPFASTGIAGLSKLSAWWIRLGIRHLRTEPGSPQQNGRHERMHRTLKQETTRPPQQTIKAQQKVFDRFRHEYNTVRPHEALAMKTPATVYVPSPRAYPKKLGDLEYPKPFITRLVSDSGEIRWHGKSVFISQALAQQYVGLQEIEDRVWSIYFADFEIARLDAATLSVK